MVPFIFTNNLNLSSYDICKVTVSSVLLSMDASTSSRVSLREVLCEILMLCLLDKNFVTLCTDIFA